MFKLILEKTADINAKDYNGDTALHIAIDNESKHVVEELLNHKGLDVNVKNNDNLTALHLASCWPNFPIHLFKIILQKSTDINAKDNDGDTALHIAIYNESKTTAKKLLKHKDMDVNVKNNDSLTAFHLTCQWKSIPDKLFKIVKEKSRDVYIA